ncbi:hypothetical protein CBR_g41104 [Chara braunii]|uniref:Uncharacterized protein n=1 Tax=Chara braunii TaxID=69332 RepID=A0A388LV51_CHABU|nr:hypothetical protein CBR_g41104 [Chara braunii]|eukprot:GBG86200.1 hypothetical protein CBR_g41104 [Chara braunii]
MAKDILGLEEEEEVIPRRPNQSKLYVWGYNVQGQTSHDAGVSGDPRTWRCQRTPKAVPLERLADSKRRPPIYLVHVACGLQHTAAVTSDGDLYTWGANDFGQLGDGGEDDCREPRRVIALRKEFVTSIACGAQCTAVITRERRASDGGEPAEGRLWVWGQNQGSNLPRLFPGAMPPKSVIKAISCGASHAAAISTDGLLQTWGYNEFGQLGRGFSCEGLQEARYTCGRGDYGQLGHRVLQTGLKEVLLRRVVSLEGIRLTQVACGQMHTCVVTSKGALYIWGGGREGQLGFGHRQEMVPVLGADDNAAISRLPVLLMSRGVKMVACGQSHTLASTVDGRLWGWGYNSSGQAATGRAAYAWRPSPIDWCVGQVAQLAAGGGHSAVLTQAFTLKDLCEYRLAESVTVPTAPAIEDIAGRHGADGLMRFCERFRIRVTSGQDEDVDEDEERRRRPRTRPRSRLTTVAIEWSSNPTGSSNLQSAAEHPPRAA